MIPTMILYGAIFGRWWRFALIAAAIVWPAALLIDGTLGIEPELVGASLLAIVNAAAGVAAHQAALWAIRRSRAPRRSAS